jgi:hypothetical protein
MGFFCSIQKKKGNPENKTLLHTSPKHWVCGLFANLGGWQWGFLAFVVLGKVRVMPIAKFAMFCGLLRS